MDLVNSIESKDNRDLLELDESELLEKTNTELKDYLFISSICKSLIFKIIFYCISLTDVLYNLTCHITIHQLLNKQSKIFQNF